MAKAYMKVPGDPNAPPIRVEVSDEVYQDGADAAAKLYLDSNQDVSNYIKGKLRLLGVPPTDLATLYNEARLHFAKHRQDSTRPGTEGFRLNLGYAGLGPEEGGGEGNPLPRGFSETNVAELKKLSNLRRELFEKRKTDPNAPGPIDLAVEGGKSDPQGMPFDITADNVEMPTTDPIPPVPPAGNVNTQMGGAMNTGQSLGNLAGSLASTMPGAGGATAQNANTINIPTPVTPSSPDFSQYLNQDQTGIRPELQVDLSNFEKDYLAANPDVAQAVGNTPGGGIQHYFDHGKKEGRSGASPALQNLTPLDYQALTANPNDPNLSPEVRNRMLEGFKARDVGRATGYQGVFTGLEGGENYDRFKTAVGSRSNFADAYGRQTALGREEEQRDAPSLIKGTFDEEQYLKDNPDVAQAVRAGTISSGKEHYDAFGSIEGRAKPTEGGTELNLQRLKANPNEFLDAKNYTIDPTKFDIDAKTAAIDTARDAVKTKVGDFTAQERYDLVAKENIEAAQQKELSDKVNAQKGIVSKDATVQGQLESLMAQFDGGEIPAFAAGAIRTAEQRLAARGMGASSMAGAAIVQAAMEASTPIAAADAQTYARMNELNLNNRQQAEVLNAQMALQLDVANLNNEQQARVTNVANRVQSLFTDQAAVNSSRQFNAANEQQNDQFFANLFNDTAKFNTAQTNGLRQFNAGQENAIEQFNSTLADNREQFNQKNSIIIDQANAVYRRNINTSNTAIANAEAEYNTRNLFNISQNAQNRLLQEQRDQINFARVNSLNETAFQNNLALSSYAFDRDLELAGDIATGSVVGDLLGSAFDAGFKALPSLLKK